MCICFPLLPWLVIMISTVGNHTNMLCHNCISYNSGRVQLVPLLKISPGRNQSVLGLGSSLDGLGEAMSRLLQAAGRIQISAALVLSSHLLASLSQLFEATCFPHPFAPSIFKPASVSDTSHFWICLHIFLNYNIV